MVQLAILVGIILSWFRVNLGNPIVRSLYEMTESWNDAARRRHPARTIDGTVHRMHAVSGQTPNGACVAACGWLVLLATQRTHVNQMARDELRDLRVGDRGARTTGLQVRQ